MSHVNVMLTLQVLNVQSPTPYCDFSEGSLENSKWNDVLVSIASNTVLVGR